MTSVLLMSADIQWREHVADQLTADCHETQVTGSLTEALLAAQMTAVDAIVVDLDTGDRDGLRLIRQIREDEIPELGADTFAIGLLEPGTIELDVVRAYEAGADDVTCRPIGYPELRCRLDAIVRRARVQALRRRKLGPLEIDLAARAAFLQGTEVPLSKLEYELLATLSAEPERVYTKDELMRAIWGMSATRRTRTLDSHCCRLRGKLGQGYIRCRWGHGYSLLSPS